MIPNSLSLNSTFIDLKNRKGHTSFWAKPEITYRYKIVVEDQDGLKSEPDDSIVRLASNTLFKINQASFPEKEARRFSARLFLGRMWAKVTSRIGTPRGTFNAHTPTAVAGVRGTVYNLEVAKDTSTNIWVYEGKVGVGPPVLVEGGSKDEIAWPAEVSEKKWAEIILARLQRLHIGVDGKPGKPASFDPAQEKDEWTVWNLQRDRR